MSNDNDPTKHRQSPEGWSHGRGVPAVVRGETT